MTRFGWGLAMLVSVIVALYVGQAFRQFANDLRSHIPARAGDVEAATRAAGGKVASGGNIVRRHLHLSSRFLSSGSERPL